MRLIGAAASTNSEYDSERGLSKLIYREHLLQQYKETVVLNQELDKGNTHRKALLPPVHEIKASTNVRLLGDHLKAVSSLRVCQEENRFK